MCDIALLIRNDCRDTYIYSYTYMHTHAGIYVDDCLGLVLELKGDVEVHLTSIQQRRLLLRLHLDITSLPILCNQSRCTRECKHFRY